MKIILCNPANPYPDPRQGTCLPLGLLSMATKLKGHFGNKIDVKILDAEAGTVKPEMFKGADIVGFHANSFNYQNCLALSVAAKECGAQVLLGGPHATVLWKNIMRNRPHVDYIIINEGEVPLLLLAERIIQGKHNEISRVPNLVYRDGKARAVRSLKTYANRPRDMVIPSRDFLNVERYIANCQRLFVQEQGQVRPLTIYSSKGCSWRDKTGGCIFCARLEKGVRFRDADLIWQEIAGLKRLYRTDFIWDISDTILNNSAWFKSFVEKRPAELADVKFFVYSRVDAITDDVTRYLKKLNVTEVVMGFESGDDRILKRTNKGAGVKIALRAARRLKSAGIRYFPSFVLGLPGETEDSLKHTLHFAEDLAEIGSLARMSADILVPLPGSLVYRMMAIHPKISDMIVSQDAISVRDLVKLWIMNFTRVDGAAIRKYQGLIGEVIGRGW